MIFLLIFATAGLQAFVLFLLRKEKTFRLQWVLSAFALILHVVFLPNAIINYEEGLRDLECGMPVFAIYLNFWIIGGPVTFIVTMIAYGFWTNRKNGKKR